MWVTFDPSIILILATTINNPHHLHHDHHQHYHNRHHPHHDDYYSNFDDDGLNELNPQTREIGEEQEQTGGTGFNLNLFPSNRFVFVFEFVFIFACIWWHMFQLNLFSSKLFLYFCLNLYLYLLVFGGTGFHLNLYPSN